MDSPFGSFLAESFPEVNALQSRKTLMDTTLKEVFETSKNHLKDAMRDIPFSLIVDESPNSTARECFGNTLLTRS